MHVLAGAVAELPDGRGAPVQDAGVVLPAAADPCQMGQRPVDRDPHQVCARAGDLLGCRDLPPGNPCQPGLLQHILGVGDAAQHVVDDGKQQLAMIDEDPRRDFFCGASAAAGHPPTARDTALGLPADFLI